MASKKRVEPWIFLTPTLIAALICLGVLIIIALVAGGIRQGGRKNQQYKQTLFLALQGKETEAKYQIAEAISDGRYLRQLYAQNADLEKFWNKEWLYRTVMKEADDSDKRKAYQEAILKTDKDAAEIFALINHSGWLELNTKERRQIPLILAGKANAPAISVEGQLLPGSQFWLIGIMASQFLCFLVYLIYWDDEVYNDTPWYRLPWGVPAVTIVFLLLQPGALIIIIPYAVIKVLATDFADRFKQRKARKESAPKTKASFNFDKATTDAQALAKRLRNRLEEGDND